MNVKDDEERSSAYLALRPRREKFLKYLGSMGGKVGAEDVHLARAVTPRSSEANFTLPRMNQYQLLSLLLGRSSPKRSKHI